MGMRFSNFHRDMEGDGAPSAAQLRQSEFLRDYEPAALPDDYVQTDVFGGPIAGAGRKLTLLRPEKEAAGRRTRASPSMAGDPAALDALATFSGLSEIADVLANGEGTYFSDSEDEDALAVVGGAGGGAGPSANPGQAAANPDLYSADPLAGLDLPGARFTTTLDDIEGILNGTIGPTAEGGQPPVTTAGGGATGFDELDEIFSAVPPPRKATHLDTAPLGGGYLDLDPSPVGGRDRNDSNVSAGPGFDELESMMMALGTTGNTAGSGVPVSEPAAEPPASAYDELEGLLAAVPPASAPATHTAPSTAAYDDLDALLAVKPPPQRTRPDDAPTIRVETPTRGPRTGRRSQPAITGSNPLAALEALEGSMRERDWDETAASGKASPTPSGQGFLDPLANLDKLETSLKSREFSDESSSSGVGMDGATTARRRSRGGGGSASSRGSRSGGGRAAASQSEVVARELERRTGGGGGGFLGTGSSGGGGTMRAGSASARLPSDPLAALGLEIDRYKKAAGTLDARDDLISDFDRMDLAAAPAATAAAAAPPKPSKQLKYASMRTKPVNPTGANGTRTLPRARGRPQSHAPAPPPPVAEAGRGVVNAAAAAGAGAGAGAGGSSGSHALAPPSGSPITRRHSSAGDGATDRAAKVAAVAGLILKWAKPVMQNLGYTGICFAPCLLPLFVSGCFRIQKGENGGGG